MTIGRLARPHGRVWQRRIWQLARILLGVILGAALFDRVIMPRVVGHGADAVVPDVTDRALTEGTRRLEEAELHRGRVVEVSHPTVPAGRVIRQEPAAGSRVRRGRAIQLVVSSGTPEREVPDLTGLTIRHAGIELSQRGLQTGEIVELPSADFAGGEILGSRPAPGESPGPTGRIDLLVSGGAPRRLYQMPDLRGRVIADAVATLRAAGIAVTSRAGTVLVTRQEPAPGEPIWSASSVYLE